LEVADTAIDALVANVKAKKANGYAPSTGTAAARAAIAERSSEPEVHLSYTANDVIIASGCSGALALVIQAIANAGDNILIPRPGFSLYLTLCGHDNIEARHYNLVPERSWECDLAQMEALIDAKTRAVLINNPSNPCGANFSREHLEAILRLCEKHRVPLIADEVYADMVFSDQTFYPAAAVCAGMLFAAHTRARAYLPRGADVSALLGVSV
jgi:tyrosine aminotransferase